jgi:hypothetical protein
LTANAFSARDHLPYGRVASAAGGARFLVRHSKPAVALPRHPGDLGRHFGDDLTRGQAAVLLETWQWQPPLSQREHETLLMRFSR